MAKDNYNPVIVAAILLLLVPAGGRAQDRPECRGRIYTDKDVTERAKLINRPEINSVDSVAHGQPAHVAVRAVLCRTGRVTDIKLIAGQPSDLTEYLKRAVANVTFTPAELNWHSVSQAIEFQFDINGGETKVISSAEAKGRLVERLEVIGNRRLTHEQILAWLTISPGDPYDADQVQRDLMALLAKGVFDKLQTRVTIEDGPRGGVGVIFDVVELPLIRELKIAGVDEADRLAVLRTLALAHVERDSPFDIAQVKLAATVIKRLLTFQGWEDVQVNVSDEVSNPTEVNVTFSISGHKSQ